MSQSTRPNNSISFLYKKSGLSSNLIEIPDESNRIEFLVSTWIQIDISTTDFLISQATKLTKKIFPNIQNYLDLD